MWDVFLGIAGNVGKIASDLSPPIDRGPRGGKEGGYRGGSADGGWEVTFCRHLRCLFRSKFTHDN